jgi:hypothetical protein
MGVNMNKIAPLVTLALGVGLGAWWGHHQAAPEIAPAAGARPDMPFLPAAPAVAASIDLSALRGIIREELASALAAKEGVKRAAPPEPPSPELAAKRREAQEDIEAMVAGGVWGNEQRATFQQRLSELAPAERERALQQVFTGLNQGTLKVETNGPPL